jgi:hypothetical protein
MLQAPRIKGNPKPLIATQQGKDIGKDTKGKDKAKTKTTKRSVAPLD